MSSPSKLADVAIIYDEEGLCAVIPLDHADVGGQKKLQAAISKGYVQSKIYMAHVLRAALRTSSTLKGFKAKTHERVVLIQPCTALEAHTVDAEEGLGL